MFILCEVHEDEAVFDCPATGACPEGLPCGRWHLININRKMEKNLVYSIESL